MTEEKCSLADVDGKHFVERMVEIPEKSVCDGYVDWRHLRCPECGYEADWDAVRLCQVGRWTDSPYWDKETGDWSEECL